MARRIGLKHAGISTRLALIAGLVLLAHALMLNWLARQQAGVHVLRPLANPIFTRMLAPQPPPAPVPSSKENRPRVRTRPADSAIKSIAPDTSPAEPAAVQPTPQPQPSTDAADIGTQTEAPAGADAQTAATSPAAPPEGTASSPSQAQTSDAAAAASDASTDTWPRDTRLNYTLGGQYRSGPLFGSARVQWQRDGNLYQAKVEFEITLAGGRTMTSQGEVTTEGLVPRAYEEMRNGKSRGVLLRDGELVFADGRTAPRPPGVQDTASQFVELSHRFATGREPLEIGRKVDIWLARPGAVDLWTYDIVGRETLRTSKLGELETFRLKPRPIANPRGNITAEIWFAPTLQYLPVRIRVSLSDEDYVDLMVETIEQR